MASRVTEEEARTLFIKNDLRPQGLWTNTTTPFESECLRCHNTVAPTYNKVRLRGHQCKFCSSHNLSKEEIDKIMAESRFQPLVDYPGSGKPWKCQCKICGKTTSPTFSNIKKGVGCKYCSKRAVEAFDAVDSMKKRGFSVLEEFPGATLPWKVLCDSCGRESQVFFHSLNTDKRCAYCSKVKVDIGELLLIMNDLNLVPLEEYQSAKTPWKCKCKICGNIVQPTWSRIQQGRGQCAYCAQRRVNKAEAADFMKSVDLLPLVPFPGSAKPWPSRCLNCNSEVQPRWSDLRRGQGGCSSCANFGLDFNEPGYLYLVTHSKLDSIKVGIANSYKSRKFDDRLYQHQKRGWVLYKRMDFETLLAAHQVESRILSWIRQSVGAPVHLSKGEMPQGGWTETVSADFISEMSIWRQVELFAEDI